MDTAQATISIDSPDQATSGDNGESVKSGVVRGEGDNGSATVIVPGRPVNRGSNGEMKLSLGSRIYDWFDTRISRLSTRNNFWHRVCSWVWLPFAYRSGIKICKGSSNTFSAILPFRRFNRNWYNAMAGAALLGNSEVAGGMYVFSKCGADYTVVCKHMEYTFLRPCVGPAVYRVEPREQLDVLLSDGGEFNITLDMQIYQMVYSERREPRVGKCVITFHVTPKAQERLRKERRRLQNKRKRKSLSRKTIDTSGVS